jgi:hypothetical protein
MGNNIVFKGPAHKQRFAEAIQRIGGKIYNGAFDPEYAAAVYILTADLSTWRKAGTYVARDGIDFESLLEEVDFSGSYQVLIKWAGNLFNEQQHLDPIEILRLDDSNFQVALSALLIRRYSLQVSDFGKASQQGKGE